MLARFFFYWSYHNVSARSKPSSGGMLASAGQVGDILMSQGKVPFSFFPLYREMSALIILGTPGLIIPVIDIAQIAPVVHPKRPVMRT